MRRPLSSPSPSPLFTLCRGGSCRPSCFSLKHTRRDICKSVSCASLIIRPRSPLPPLAPCTFRSPPHAHVCLCWQWRREGAGQKHNWRLAFGGRRRETGERKEGRHPGVEEVSDDSCIAEVHLTQTIIQSASAQKFFCFFFSTQSTVQVGDPGPSVCWMIIWEVQFKNEIFACRRRFLGFAFVF